MKKGLTLALMTVAVALLGLQVMAMAPVISDIPSPIVGAVAGQQATNATPFVFQNAIDLRAYVSSNDVPTTAILWSYEVAAPTFGTTEYLINGVQPNPGLTSATLVQPGQYQINLAANVKDPLAGSNPNVITIRNAKYAPLTGSGQSTASLSGINASDTQEITFVASDGTTVSTPQKGAEVFFYTDFSGISRISTPAYPSVPVTTMNFPGSTNGFTNSIVYSGKTSGTGVVASTTNGLCFQVTTDRLSLGDSGNGGVSNIATNTSAWNVVPYVDGQLYRFRLTLIGDQAAGNQIPLWDFMIESEGTNYATDLSIMDSWGHGNQNAVLNKPKTFDVYFTPMAVATSGWTDQSTGAFALDAKNGGKELAMNAIFRFIDSDANSAVASYLRFGTVCLKSMQVDRCDLNAVTSVHTDWAINPQSGGAAFKDCVKTGTGNYWTQAILAGDVTASNNPFTVSTLSNGSLEITPPAATTLNSVELLNIFPGTDSKASNALSSTFGTTNPDSDADAALVTELYPVPWKASTLYRFQADMSAPTLTDEQNQMIGIIMAFNTVSQEANLLNQATMLGGGWDSATSGSLQNRNYPGPDMPKYNKPNNTFQAFFWSQTPTGGAVTGQSGYGPNPETYMDYIKPFIYFTNPGGSAWQYNGTMTGSTIISRLQVDEVTTPLAP